MKLIIKTYYTFYLLLYYLIKLIQANFILAFEILTPRMRLKPFFIEIPLHIKSDFGLLMFSNLLSMTPGSLSIDMDHAKKTLMVHILTKDDPRESEKQMMWMQQLIHQITG